MLGIFGDKCELCSDGKPYGEQFGNCNKSLYKLLD